MHLNQLAQTIGSFLTRLPVAAKAFATAGATGAHLVRLRRLDFRLGII